MRQSRPQPFRKQKAHSKINVISGIVIGALLLVLYFTYKVFTFAPKSEYPGRYVEDVEHLDLETMDSLRNSGKRAAPRNGSGSRKIVYASNGGSINTGVWPGWGSRETTLNWAAAGVVVKKICPFDCAYEHETTNNLKDADVVIVETVNHPKFGLKGPIPLPERTRKNNARSTSSSIEMLPAIGAFYYEPAKNYPHHTALDPALRNAVDFFMTPDMESTLPVTLICPWGREVRSFLRSAPEKYELIAHFSEHGADPEIREFVDNFIDLAGERLHAFQNRRNRPMPFEAGGDPYSLETRMKFLEKYKFVFITEGSLDDSYINPEWSQAFLAGVVPVYMGSRNIHQFAPGPRSFINARDFNTVDELWDYILRVDADDEAYAEFFEWKVGAKAAFEVDEGNYNFVLGTGSGVNTGIRDYVDIGRDIATASLPLRPSPFSSQKLRSLSQDGWRLFRTHLNNCVHYAECRICEYAHLNTL